MDSPPRPVAAQVDIRPTRTEDLPSILQIINREIREGVAHFGTSETGLDELEAEWRSTCERYPWLTASDAGEVVGYAKAGPWKTRGAYRWSAEVGIYIRPDHHGQGIGRKLYDVLFPALRDRGLRTIIAGVTLPNPASVRLHEAMGMTHAATFSRVGFKHGRWHDVGYWQLHWDEDLPPA